MTSSISADRIEQLGSRLAAKEYLKVQFPESPEKLAENPPAWFNAELQKDGIASSDTQSYSEATRAIFEAGKKIHTEIIGRTVEEFERHAEELRESTEATLGEFEKSERERQKLEKDIETLKKSSGEVGIWPWVTGFLGTGLVTAMGYIGAGEKFKSTVFSLGTFLLSGGLTSLGKRLSTDKTKREDGWGGNWGGTGVAAGGGLLTLLGYYMIEDKFKDSFMALGAVGLGILSGLKSETMRNGFGFPTGEKATSESKAKSD